VTSHRIRTATYPDIRPSLQTGDLFLAHGTADISEAIELAEGDCNWSHVGMIVRLADLIPAGHQVPSDLPDPLLFEATQMISDAERKQERTVRHLMHTNPDGQYSGPILVSLDDRIRADLALGQYSYFAVRALHVAPSPARITALQRFAYAIASARPRFPGIPWQMIADAYRGRFEDLPERGATWNPKGVNPPLATYFCAELVAHSYMRMGLLSRKHPPNGYIPKDFSGAGRLSLLDRAFHGPECWFDSF